LSTDQLVTFMSGGVAARVEAPAFLDALRALRAELGTVPSRKRVRALFSHVPVKRRTR
jgi:hypothetical protein